LIHRSQTETKLKLYDTYFWHKKNGIPNGGKKRFRNMTEFIFHFCKNPKEMKFYMDRVLEEPSEGTKKRTGYDNINNHGVTKDGVRTDKSVARIENMLNGVRPDNVFRFATAGTERDNTIKHPAPFNRELPMYYINLLTDEGDVVLDPFSGIGTSGVACKELNRDYIGYELNETYHNFTINRLNDLEGDTYVVNQYSMDDEFIKSYPNRSSAGKELNLCEEDIMRCYRGNRKSVGGYKFKLEKI
jgi:DNA modification methylase